MDIPQKLSELHEKRMILLSWDPNLLKPEFVYQNEKILKHSEGKNNLESNFSQ
jgi:hypothetical protein